jgi:hypothetical protein
VASNLLLRFSWAHRLLGDLEAHNAVLLAVAMLEVLRRHQWAYARFENELRQLGALPPRLLEMGAQGRGWAAAGAAEGGGGKGEGRGGPKSDGVNAVAQQQAAGDWLDRPSFGGRSAGRGGQSEPAAAAAAAVARPGGNLSGGDLASLGGVSYPGSPAAAAARGSSGGGGSATGRVHAAALWAAARPSGNGSGSGARRLGLSGSGHGSGHGGWRSRSAAGSEDVESGVTTPKTHGSSGSEGEEEGGEGLVRGAAGLTHAHERHPHLHNLHHQQQ